jgi:hypothetical protein
MAVAAKRPFSPSDVVAALLCLLPKEFSNDPEKIHTTIARLQKIPRYRWLLGDFEFLDYDPYPYSPMLGRTLNRLQESRLLSSINPDYQKYQVNSDSRKAIREEILGKKLVGQEEKLREIASALRKVL